MSTLKFDRFLLNVDHLICCSRTASVLPSLKRSTEKKISRRHVEKNDVFRLVLAQVMYL